ncbi:MAG: bifunctional riboflavin kinase/FAD synthetase [Desulfovibrio sp.]|jgi:riboflavin kinase/FMN adenylyltransferase|nr:bifunctional riboflavin kinase/FAD synthetase [Desulfovibrio sp.]
MQVLSSVDEFDSRPTGITIGNFDGVHKGHQALIARAMEVSRQEGLDFVLVTFWPHPRKVVHPEKPHAPLNGRRRRMELLEGLGVPRVLELSFTREFAGLTPHDFATAFLVPLQVRRLVVGHDFTLGRDRSGTVDVLRHVGRTSGFDVEQLAPVLVDGHPVSSTRLRRLIGLGDVEGAFGLLGRRFGVCGQVVHGDGRGKGLGFPTANLEASDCLLPASGVYATRFVARGVAADAVTNVGVRPTFGGEGKTVESFLLDEAGRDLYGVDARVDFVARLRDERKFEDGAALKAQIADDVGRARPLLQAAVD